MDLVKGMKNDPVLAPYIRVNVSVPPPMKAAVKAVVTERQRQDEKWGEQNHHPVYWVGMLTEELGEVSKESIELYQHNGESLAEAFGRLRSELVQLAAVALAAIECIDRQQAQQ